MVTSKPTVWAEVDEQGRLVLPPEIAGRYGLTPGSRVRLDDGDNSVRMHRPVTHLTKVYLEPTAMCNLDCRTCIRNVWDEELGRMSDVTFAAILDSLKTLSPPRRCSSADWASLCSTRARLSGSPRPKR
jgi:bifunctional DNA-binding transcriptional regulator/antitoxin component of YhaV-PrlF toxin-antitoxin module